MTIRDQENALFDEWESARPDRKGFARDGVVSEADYFNSKLKIVFILKEVNDPGSEGWDLRDYLLDGAPGGGSTWNNIARWTKGIRNRNKPLDWVNFEEIIPEVRQEELKSICAINLKKMPGGSSADEQLWAMAKEDSDFIMRQYFFYNPDITVCCGNDISGLFWEDVAGHGKPEWKRTTRGVYWIERETGKYVIEVNHPQQRSVRDSLLFYELIDAVNELYPQ